MRLARIGAAPSPPNFWRANAGACLHSDLRQLHHLQFLLVQSVFASESPESKLAPLLGEFGAACLTLAVALDILDVFLGIGAGAGSGALRFRSSGAILRASRVLGEGIYDLGWTARAKAS